MKNIQVGILIIFGIFILIGVFVFAGIIPSPVTKKQKETTGKVVIWGTLEKNIVEMAIRQQISSKYNGLLIQYSEHRADTFANDLIEALAGGTGPDIMLLPDDLIVRFSTKVEPFTAVMYPERVFRDTFIEEGELFISPKAGILALPFAIDPMVMYWNRNMFSAADIARPPAYWDEFLVISPLLSKRNEAKDILKSAVAFGEFRNVTHAKDILALLIIQTGNPLVKLAEKQNGTTFTPTLDGSLELNIPPADEAIRFYTDFADPEKPIYSWNRSLSESKNAFLSQDLAIYFGYASELDDIRAKNPNLNFDTSRVPQVRDLPFKNTFGKMLGVAVMKTSVNKPGAFFVAGLLTAPEFNKKMSEALHLPPVHRALLAKDPPDPFMKVFYDSALIGKSWLDVNPGKTSVIFQTVIDSIIAGKVRLRDAVGRAQAELSLMAQ